MTCSNRPLVRRKAVVATISVILLALIVVSQRPRLELPPEEVRPYFVPTDARLPSQGLLEQEPSGIHRGWSSYGHFTGQWTKKRFGFGATPSLRLEADDGQIITFPSGETASIASIETVYPTGPGPDDYVLQSFDGATFEPRDIAHQERSQEWFTSGKVYPKVAIEFGGEAYRRDERFLFENGVPPRQNHSEKPDRYGGSQVFWRIPWYSMPAIVSAEFWYGDLEHVVLPLKADTIYRHSDFEILFLAAGHIDQSGHGELSISSYGRELGFSPTFTPATNLKSGFTVFVFRCRRIHDYPGNLRWKSADALPEVKSRRSIFERFRDDVVFAVLPDDPTGPVTRIEMTFQKRATGVFRLPDIPGLPAENYHLDNLFDTKIIYAHFDGEEPYEYGWYLPNCLGLKYSLPYADRDIPRLHYPITFQDATYLELLNDYCERRNLVRFDLNQDYILEGKLSRWSRFSSWASRRVETIRKHLSVP